MTMIYLTEPELQLFLAGDEQIVRLTGT